MAPPPENIEARRGLPVTSYGEASYCDLPRWSKGRTRSSTAGSPDLKLLVGVSKEAETTPKHGEIMFDTCPFWDPSVNLQASN